MPSPPIDGSPTGRELAVDEIPNEGLLEKPLCPAFLVVTGLATDFRRARHSEPVEWRWF